MGSCGSQEANTDRGGSTERIGVHSDEEKTAMADVCMSMAGVRTHAIAARDLKWTGIRRASATTAIAEAVAVASYDVPPVGQTLLKVGT